MIKIKIGDTEMNANEIDPSWINQQIVRRRQDGENVCVMVIIEEPPLNMVLSTPTCARSYGRREPNPQEREIFELWGKYKLNTNEFTGGNLIAFLNKIT